MFQLYANKNQLAVRRREPVTSGSVNVYQVRFEFSPDWEGLERTAVFRAGTESRSVPLDDSGVCEIPWEVLASQGRRLSAGVYGTQGASLMLPTVWADLGAILEGAAPGEASRPPTPELWRQELDKKGDALDYDGQELHLKSGEKILSSVEIAGGGALPVPGPPGPAGSQGAPGEDGATFTPSVSEDGTLSWSNDKGLPNPEPVNIQGPPGEPGGGSGGSVSSGTAVKVMTPEEYRGLTVEEQQKDVLYVVSGSLSEDITWWSPKMTSNNTPAPYVASASSEYVGNATKYRYYAFRAFDGIKDGSNFDDAWYATDSNRWIQIDFGTNMALSGVRMYPAPTAQDSATFPRTVTIKTSIDGSAWDTVFIGGVAGYDPTTNFDPMTIEFEKTVTRFVKIECGAGYSGINQTIIKEIEFKSGDSGSALYYKGVRVMTSGGGDTV